MDCVDLLFKTIGIIATLISVEKRVYSSLFRNTLQQKPVSYRTQSMDALYRSVGWFQYYKSFY